MGGLGDGIGICPGVVPVLVGPLQVLLTILPGLLVALAGGLIALFKPSGLKNAARLLWRQKIAVGFVAFLGIGIYFGKQHFWPRGAAGEITVAQKGSDWTTARYDLHRTGAVPGSSSPTRAELIWAYRNGEESFYASPAVVGNRIYIASKVGVISRSGMIDCLDADTGAVVWSNAPPDYRPTFSSPVIAGDYLVCGEGLHDTRDARVVCLDLRNEGKVLWTFRTNNHVECTPIIANGRVYVGAGDDGYYCLDLQPGPDGEAVVHWHKPTEEYPDAETSLAVHEGKVYGGLGNDGAALVVLDAITGQELHRLKMPYPVFSPASIADGKLYIGMGNGDYVKPGEGGEVRCLDLKTMKTEWTFPLPQTVLGAVAVKDDKLYFGCNDQHLYCLNRAGKLHKKFNTLAPIKTSPAVTDQHVFIVNEAGLLFALDRLTLEPLWEFRLGSGGLFISSPAVARGHVYVGTEKDGLLCVGAAGSAKPVPHWFAPLGGPGVAGNSDNTPLVEGSEILWAYPSPEDTKGATIVAPVAVWQEQIIVARTGEHSGRLECLAVEKDDKQSPRLVWSYATDNGIWQSPVVLGDTVACADGQPGGARRQIHFVERTRGTALARHPLGPSASGIVTATARQFLVQSDGQHLSSFDEQGNQQWSAVVGRLASAPAGNDACILAVAQEPRQAVLLDRATGAVLWRAPLKHVPVATPLLEKQKFILATQHGLEARSLIDGQLLSSWHAEVGVPSGELALENALVVFVNQQGEVVALDRADGKVTARVPGALPGQTPLVSRGKVVYAAAGRLLTFALGKEDPTPELWLDLPMLTAPDVLPTNSLVLKDSRLFLVMPGRGLACVGRPQ